MAAVDSNANLVTHLPSLLCAQPHNKVHDSVCKVVTQLNPSVCEGSLLPPGAGRQGEGNVLRVPPRVPSRPWEQGQVDQLTCCCIRCRGRAVR